MSFSSHKWIHVGESSNGSRSALSINDITNVFHKVKDNRCNLISIFGRARQGKSFMMNLLAGEKEIFKISNEKDSCTQGIDISDKWCHINDFSRIDNGVPVQGDTMIGFVDAEGQGDKDVNYDANLVCPILLASKCVIFNWKGDLQKDHILSTLGIMTRAAKNVSSEANRENSSGDSAKKFGHLHIVFRDWQAVSCSEQSVFDTLFNLELNNSEAQTRNQIRKDLMACFTSINVWLFEAPVDSLKDLKKKLSIDMTTNSFREKLRNFRYSLASQLREPTLVAYRPLTGKTMGMFVRQIAQSLNSGEAVLPSSAYKAMMKQEASHLLTHFQSSLQKELQTIINDLERKASLVNAAFPTENEAQKLVETVFDSLLTSFNSSLASIAGDITTDIGREIAQEFRAPIDTFRSSAFSQFMNAYRANLGAFVAKLGERAEKLIHEELANLEKDEIAPLSSSQIDMTLEKILKIAYDTMGGRHKYSGEIWDARLKSLEGLLMSHRNRLIQMHENRLKEYMRLSEILLQEAKDEIQKEIRHSADMLIQQQPHGFSVKINIDMLNQKFLEIKDWIAKKSNGSLALATVQEDFQKYCSSLVDLVHSNYQTLRRKAHESEIGRAQQDIKEACDIIDSEETFQQLFQEFQNHQENEAEFFDVLVNQWLIDQYRQLVLRSRQRVEGWDDQDEDVFELMVFPVIKSVAEKEFNAAREKLFDRFSQEIAKYQEEEVEEVEEVEEEVPVPVVQERTVSPPTVSSETKMAVPTTVFATATTTTTSSTTSSKSKVDMSVAAQRQRAREYSKSILGNNKSAARKKSLVAKPSLSKTISRLSLDNTATYEDQKKKALAWAELTLFGTSKPATHEASQASKPAMPSGSASLVKNECKTSSKSSECSDKENVHDGKAVMKPSTPSIDTKKKAVVTPSTASKSSIASSTAAASTPSSSSTTSIAEQRRKAREWAQMMENKK